jgi:hypothetical protein
VSSEIIVAAQEIYNELNKARDDFPDGRTPIEALIDMVSSGDYKYNIRLEDSRVIGVFFAHKESTKFIQRFSNL